MELRGAKCDREFSVVINRCDICDDPLNCTEDIESHIDMLNEINNSYESEAGCIEPRLLLCGYCNREYLIPGYPLTYQILQVYLYLSYPRTAAIECIELLLP